ncbi:MAG: acyltransferase [Rhodanobacter sp.]|jgi:peptidoglycan/LPS O-acetylase OafA/YrhL|nr:acyltransferase [Rhodanobacter sp.]
MGAYRLFLAMCVLYSHAFGSIYGWNIGVVAVISFFIISGYVMTLLISRHYTRPHLIGIFYLDRAARLFPQYLFYMVATILCASLFDFTTPYLKDHGQYMYIALNAMILPIGYHFMFGLQHALYIPQAWSLGLEFTFYLFFPIFWFSVRWLKFVLVMISTGIAIAAFCKVFNTDWFGYRLLPGTFFIFVAGAVLAKPEMITRWKLLQNSTSQPNFPSPWAKKKSDGCCH